MTRFAVRRLLTFFLMLTAELPAQAEPPRPGKRLSVDLYGDALPPAAAARMGTVRFRHGNHVNVVCFSPKGDLIASGGEDRVLHMWDVASGREVNRLGGHETGVEAAAFSPDGKNLATGSDIVRLWEVNSGRNLRSLPTPSYVYAVAFSPDGKTLASGDLAHTICLWDVATGTMVRQLVGHDDCVDTLSFSSKGTELISGNGNDPIFIWDVATGKVIRRLGEKRFSHASALSPDGKTLAAAYVSEWIKLWDVATGGEIRELKQQRDISSLAFARDGKVLATGDIDGQILFLDPRTGKLLRAIVGHCDRVCSLSFSPDGKTLASGSWDHTVRLWDAATGKEITKKGGHQGFVSSVAVSPNGKTVISAGYDRTLRLWESATGKELRCFTGHELSIETVAFCSDGDTIASAGSDDAIRLWSARTGSELRRFGRFKDTNVLSVTFSPDGKSLASASGDTYVRLWDVASGRETRRLKMHKKDVQCVAFAPDGKCLASGGEDSTVCLWDLVAGEARRLAETDEVRAVAYSPSAKIFVTALKNGQLHLWDLASGKIIHSLIYSWPGESGRVLVSPHSVSFSSDGRLLACSGYGFGDGQPVIRIWEVASCQELRSFSSPFCGFPSVAFFPDGRFLASACTDATVLVWDITSGACAAQTDHSVSDLEKLYSDLGGSDVSRAYRAVWALAEEKKAVPFLHTRLKPVPPADPKRINQLIADLCSEQFKVRRRASQELEGLAELAAPALERALEAKLSIEARQRVTSLLSRSESWSLEQLRVLRAVTALEDIGSAKARQVLRLIADGAPEARLTMEAKSSLDRLAKRSVPP